MIESELEALRKDAMRYRYLKNTQGNRCRDWGSEDDDMDIVGVADHINIGSDVIVAGKSGVSSNVPSGRVMMGNPAMRMDLNVETYKAIRRLPRLVSKVTKLEQIVLKTNQIK